MLRNLSAVPLALCLLATNLQAAAVPCAELTGLRLADARIDRAVVLDDPVAHCKVEGVIGRNVVFLGAWPLQAHYVSGDPDSVGAYECR